MKVALLTGGKDPHYARGLLHGLTAAGIKAALISGEELANVAEIEKGRVEFHNLVGGLGTDAGLMGKVWRVLTYYRRLLVFAARTDAKLFHILWPRKFPLMERT